MEKHSTAFTSLHRAHSHYTHRTSLLHSFTSSLMLTFSTHPQRLLPTSAGLSSHTLQNCFCNFLCSTVFYSVFIHFFTPFSASTLLGDRNGIQPVKMLADGLLVVTIWLELCTSYSSSCHHNLHLLSSNKNPERRHSGTDLPVCPGKGPLNESCVIVVPFNTFLQCSETVSWVTVKASSPVNISHHRSPKLLH